MIPAGTWVEIGQVVLPAGERAPHLPEETRAVPLDLRAKGFLTAPAEPGAEAEIRTVAGRLLRGTLTTVNPAYDHGFGPPIPELLTIGTEVRALLEGSDGP